MKIEDLRYSLSNENIAREPREVRLGKRDRGKMLVINRTKKSIHHSRVLNLLDFIHQGDVIILNNSKRIEGVLRGNIAVNNAQVEIQFVSLNAGNNALCRIYPTHHLIDGIDIVIGEHKLTITESSIPPYNLFRVEVNSTSFEHLLKEKGSPITSFFYSTPWDTSYFNPFYASKEGAVESPLAGLHFTPELISMLQQNGVQVAYITLHSVGSWLPFLEEDVESHIAQPEHYEVPEMTALLVNEAKDKGNKIIACGSTSMRAIESCANDFGRIEPNCGTSELYIAPGYTFRVIDHYFTNFHPYRTSLMVLDAAFCGKDLLLESYKIAKEHNYLFFEFGDAVFYI